MLSAALWPRSCDTGEVKEKFVDARAESATRCSGDVIHAHAGDLLGGIDGEDSGAGGERGFQESTTLGHLPQ